MMSDEDTMRKLIVEAEVSLDGILDGGPEFWPRLFKYHTADVSKYLRDLLFSADALVAGRITYEGFAQVWPTRQGDDADHINGIPKYVASRTLMEPLTWNATLIKGDVPETIGKLKQESGNYLVQYGVGKLTNTLLQHGLVDELCLLVFPFIFGQGSRIFENIDPTGLTLIHTHTFQSGVVELRYSQEGSE
jgi:dihydrofolate reductase